MKITLLLLGKTTDAHIEALLREYQNRLEHYVSFQVKVLPELKQTKNLTEQQQKVLEGENILKEITASADVILLDERGTELRSVEYASWLQRKMASGRDIIFVVGGPYGFSQPVYDRANHMLSLSKMTFSHQMVRLFFVEQLYRAFTILHHEPYHHE